MVMYTYVIVDIEAFALVLHEDGVVEVEVENVTTFVRLSHLFSCIGMVW